MKACTALACLLAMPSIASAAETLFSSGPQEHRGRNYYWLAEWKLEVTLPDDVAAGDRLEVLFGSKGAARRTLYFEYDGRTGSLADVRKEPYEWIVIPLDVLAPGKQVTLFAKGRESVAFLAGVRVAGQSAGELKVTPARTAAPASADGYSAAWAELAGFLDYDLALGSARYHEAVRRPMTRLLGPRYFQFNWDSNSRDNVADSVEGGLYLAYRIPVPEWFTVEPDESHQYEVQQIETGATETLSGKSLSEGLSIRLQPNQPLRLTVQPKR